MHDINFKSNIAHVLLHNSFDNSIHCIYIYTYSHSPAIPISRSAISSTSVTTGYNSSGITSTTTLPASTGHQISGASATGKNTRSCTKLGAFKRSNRTPGTNLNESDRGGSMDNEVKLLILFP